MIAKIYGLLLRQFGRLPVSVRHRIVGFTSPAYRVGTAAILLSEAGELLLVKHSYRDGWGLPGGMIGWKEEPRDTIVREVREELGISVAEAGEPHIEHARASRRIEWFFDLRLDGLTVEDVKINSPEIEELRWFPLDDLPLLEKKSPSIARALEIIAERHFPSRLDS